MSSYSLHNERELLLRIGEGDEEAFTVLFRHYQQKIYALAFHLTESSVYAEEIVQDVFLKIWLKQTTLTAIQDFPAYLFMTARNHIYTYLKAIARHKIVSSEVEVHIPFESNTPEAQIFFKEFSDLVSQAVRKLPEQQCEVYRLSKEENKSRDEIAQHLKYFSTLVAVSIR